MVNQNAVAVDQEAVAVAAVALAMVDLQPRLAPLCDPEENLVAGPHLVEEMDRDSSTGEVVAPS